MHARRKWVNGPDERFYQAARAFGASRFQALYRAWLDRGEPVARCHVVLRPRRPRRVGDGPVGVLSLAAQLPLSLALGRHRIRPRCGGRDTRRDPGESLPPRRAPAESDHRCSARPLRRLARMARTAVRRCTYATLWFTTPFLTASVVMSLLAIVASRRPEPVRLAPPPYPHPRRGRRRPLCAASRTSRARRGGHSHRRDSRSRSVASIPA